MAVDPGKRAGWSIWVCGNLAQWGEIDGDDPEKISRVIHAGRMLALIGEIPVVLGVEMPPTHVRSGRRSFRSVMTSGGRRHLWKVEWRRQGQAERRALDVDVGAWRAAVLGARYRNAKRDDVRPVEQARAQALATAATPPPPPTVGRPTSHEQVFVATVGPDCAPAICLGQYLALSSELAKAIPPRFRAAA